MDRYCPECNSTMTPSLVGYLCVNCGHTQRFYSAQESALAMPTATFASEPQNNTKPKQRPQAIKHNSRPNNKVKSTLKRLMVPELAPPHHHLIGDGDDNIKPVLADKIEDELSTPAIKNDSSSMGSSELIRHEKHMEQSNQLRETSNISTPVEVPNQSGSLTELESALHPQKNTSIWVMLGLAVLMLVVAAAVLFMIILS